MEGQAHRSLAGHDRSDDLEAYTNTQVVGRSRWVTSVCSVHFFLMCCGWQIWLDVCKTFRLEPIRFESRGEANLIYSQYQDVEFASLASQTEEVGCRTKELAHFRLYPCGRANTRGYSTCYTKSNFAVLSLSTFSQITKKEKKEESKIVGGLPRPSRREFRHRKRERRVGHGICAKSAYHWFHPRYDFDSF